MADTKISALTELTAPPAPADEFVLVDKSDTTMGSGGTNKRMTYQEVTEAFSAQGMGMINGKLSVTTDSNGLLLAVKTMAGSDPTTDEAVFCWIADGLRAITAALSLSVTDNQNIFNAGSAELASQSVDYFPYLAWIGASSAVALGTSRIPYATLYSQFSATATDETHGKFSTTPASTDSVVVVGRYAATLGPSTDSYPWSIPTYDDTTLIQRPIYETRWLTWAPQHSTTGGAYTNLPTQNTAEYMIVGRFIDLDERHTQNATPGGSGYQQFTLPMSARYQFQPGGNCANESTANMFLAFFSAVTLMRLFKYDGTAQITASQTYHTNGHYPY